MNSLFSSITNFFRGVVFWVIILPWEEAIRIRAGKHVRRLRPGIHLKIPIMDEVYKQSVRWRSAFMTTQTLSTADGHTVIVGATLGYRITDIEKIYNTLHDAEATITQIAASALANAILTRNRADITPEGVGRDAQEALDSRLKDVGLADISIRATDFAFIRAFRIVNDGRWGSPNAPLNTTDPNR